MKVFVIGSGNIAFHLTKALTANKIIVSGVYSRNELNGRALAKKAKTQYYHNISSISKNSDVYLVCIADDAIAEVVKELPKTIKSNKIVAHTSGSKSIVETLNNCKKGGVFYPLQTFTKGKSMNYKNIPFCINGTTNKTKSTLFELASKVSDTVEFINDDQRKQIHLSAVFINNFVNHLIYISEDLLCQHEINPSLLQPLLAETIKKQKKIGAEAAQTGPARRQDSETLSKHINLLDSNASYKKIYSALSKSIQKKYNPKS